MHAIAPAALSLRFSDFHARRAVHCLIAVEFGLALAYVLIHVLLPDSTWGPLRPLTDLDGENSLATWFSVTQLFIVGATFVVAAFINQRAHLLPRRALVAAGWFLSRCRLMKRLSYTKI